MMEGGDEQHPHARQNTSATPIQSEGDRPPETSRPVVAAISRRKSPKRATTKPKPIIASPVRTQASKVRSAAINTRGSRGSMPPGALGGSLRRGCLLAILCHEGIIVGISIHPEASFARFPRR
jgi:hypothetical protein